MRAEDEGSPPMGSWAAADLMATARGNAGIGTDAGLPNEIRFAVGIVRLIRRRMAELGTQSDPARPAVFLLEPNARALKPEVKPKRVPMLDNGLTIVAGRLWYVNAAVVTGKYVDLDDTDDDALFSVVTDDLQLGRVPAIILEPRTTVPSVRYYPKGLVSPEEFQSLVLTGIVTLNSIFEAIDQIHSKSLVTPDAHAPAGKLWAKGAKNWPVDNAEDVVQMYLRIGLAMQFPNCDIRWEQTSISGRLDLKIEESDPLDKARFTRHAVLELKVLRSHGSTGAVVTTKSTRDWVESGVKQAASYRDDWGARESALCCFDMRKEQTGEQCFAHVRDLAAKLRVALKVWLIFGTSAGYRKFITKKR